MTRPLIIGLAVWVAAAGWQRAADSRAPGVLLRIDAVAVDSRGAVPPARHRGAGGRAGRGRRERV